MALSLGLGTVAALFALILTVEVAQFGYLWRMNSRAIRNEERSKDNEQAINKLKRGKAD